LAVIGTFFIGLVPLLGQNYGLVKNNPEKCDVLGYRKGIVKFQTSNHIDFKKYQTSHQPINSAFSAFKHAMATPIGYPMPYTMNKNKIALS